MMSQVIRNILVTTLAMGLVVVLTTNALCQGKKGKPGGGGDPPAQAVLPNVRYSLTWLAFFPREVNKVGQLVGGEFAYSDTTGTINLDDDLVGVTWLDLDENQAEAEVDGWYVVEARDINEAGEIVGTAMHPDAPRRAFILQNAFGSDLGSAPRFLLLPAVSEGLVDERGSFINNLGEAVGYGVGLNIIRYQPLPAWPYYAAALQNVSSGRPTGINDDGVIIGEGDDNFPVFNSFVQFASGGPTSYFDNHAFWAISNGIAIDGNVLVSPMISGQRQKTKGKNGQSAGVIRLPVPLLTDETPWGVELLADGLYSRSINDEGDTVFDFNRGFLFYDAINPETDLRYGTDGDGILPLDDLVVSTDLDWHATNEQGQDYYYRFDGLSNREPATEFGYITGYIAGIGKGFILTPYIPD